MKKMNNITVELLNDKYRQCSVCLYNKGGKGKRPIYKIVFPGSPCSQSINLCRKCLKELLTGGIKIYNETKGMKKNGKEK